MIKKKLFGLAMLMMLSVLSAGLTSCNSDDDDDKISSPIVGTWKTSSSSNLYMVMAFSCNGSVVMTYVNGSTTTTLKGTYEVSKGYSGVVKFYWDGDTTPEILKFSISNNKLTLQNTSSSSSALTYTKQ